ncbi:MAG TPA: NAD(P)-dependent oxidoreductase, partial [archaeon]|nr:NAD(P)-dependent oxidoreductase [archaeon]
MPGRTDAGRKAMPPDGGQLSDLRPGPIAIAGVPLHPAGRALLEKAGFAVSQDPEAVKDAEVFITYVTVCVEEPLLRLAPKLRAIVTCSAGTDHIDLKACERRGIKVFSAPGANANAVAEHTIGLMLSVLRRIAHADREVRAGEWGENHRFLSSELHGKTIGLVGLGAIGKLVAEKLSGFGVRLIGFDPWCAEAEFAERSVERLASVDALFQQADIVSLHVPLTPETYHLVDARRLSAMKEGALLINTARGEVVDEAALVEALKTRL